MIYICIIYINSVDLHNIIYYIKVEENVLGSKKKQYYKYFCQKDVVEYNNKITTDIFSNIK